MKSVLYLSSSKHLQRSYSFGSEAHRNTTDTRNRPSSPQQVAEGWRYHGDFELELFGRSGGRASVPFGSKLENTGLIP